MKRFLNDAVLAAILAMAIAPGSALALGGSASSPDPGLEAHLVMVLSRDGRRHGACTGTVVAPNIVLTAAHCIAGGKDVAVAYRENGSHVLQRINARAVHPEFSGRAKVSIDLALIRLDTALPERIRPLPLDDSEGGHGVGENKTIAGFGIARDGVEATAGTLRSAQVPILPRFYPRFLRLGPGPSSDLDDFAICTGDSGGPVLARGLGGTTIVGVVYGREKFAGAETCGITAQAVRIAPQRKWIDGVIARWQGRT